MINYFHTIDKSNWKKFGAFIDMILYDSFVGKSKKDDYAKLFSNSELL